MSERILVLKFTCFGLIAGFLSQYLLKIFGNILFSFLIPLLLFSVSIFFEKERKEKFLNHSITFFSVWFVFWMILYGL